jgi:predicted enzyme related to lactoylglutathione lyase
MNKSVYFEIQADEPSKAVDFYHSVFGWKFVHDENIPIEYWRLQVEGYRGAILKRPAKTPPIGTGTNAFVCSFEVENFDETASKIAIAGGQVALPKFAVPGRCWQGYFLDIDNNTFGIFQIDEKAA